MANEEKAKALASNILDEIRKVDKPNINARGMLTDKSMWEGISKCILEAVEDAILPDEPAENPVVEEDNEDPDDKPRRRRGGFKG